MYYFRRHQAKWSITIQGPKFEFPGMRGFMTKAVIKRMTGDSPCQRCVVNILFFSLFYSKDMNSGGVFNPEVISRRRS